MIFVRLSTLVARMNFYYCLHCCAKRPFTLLILVSSLLCCLLLIHHYSDPSEASSQKHGLKLTRRNISSAYYYYNSDDRSPTKRRLQNLASTDPLPQADHRSDLLKRIEDLKRIKLSINNELRLIEREKAKLLREKASLISKNDRLIAQIGKSKTQLRQLELDIAANRRQKFEQTCDINRVAPIIFNPMKSNDIKQYFMPKKAEAIGYQRNSTDPNHYDLINRNINQSDDERQEYAFDLSLCPLTRLFKFYLLETSNSINEDDNKQIKVLTYDQRLRIDPTLVRDVLQSHRQYTSNKSEACLMISILTETSTIDNQMLWLNKNENNLVINLVLSDIDENYSAISPSKELQNSAALASPVFHSIPFRQRFDLVLPSIWQAPLNYDKIINSIPPQSPIERKYLASYFGYKARSASSKHISSSALNPLEKKLQIIHRNSIDDLFLFIYDCGPESNMQCYEEKEKMIELSTFLIILPFNSGKLLEDDNNNDLIYSALSRGAVPVIFGSELSIRLPFDEVIDWRRALILLPTARISEIHFILRSMSAADIYQLKYHGKRIFENYLATAKQILDTTISAISVQRFNYPPPPVQDLKTIIYNQDPNQPFIIDTNCTSATCLEAKNEAINSPLPAEIFGPRERPFASPAFRRNFSLILNSAYDLWNSPLYSPMQLFPSSPLDPLPPSEYKFLSPDQGYRPIGDGLGGSGVEFSRALGGDNANEQFTIVLLTYERKAMLLKTLERLKGLAYLNKIVVVWNGVKQRPAANTVWPDVGVPIDVVKVDRNSLNNRFLPYDAIETDAIFSMDDDSPLRPDEIVFAFRVWRQARDRIVGFPGRFHAWDSNQLSWLYNSNHSCELSMVLTGGAFFHKYYSYMYTYSMPEAIRSIVDKFMNCEDIAMNFLVAHLIRKPPIKVTSRWTFHCASCASSLSEEDSHFRERHECLNTFASIYGYMPLMSTQHRSDSILFKTRLPHDKQKCFKFV